MKKILVVVDMQNDFIDGSLGTREAQEIVHHAAAMIRAAKKDGAHIVCTMDTHESGYLQTREGQNLPVEHCVIGTEGWELNEKILDALGPDFARRMKHQVDWFREGHTENYAPDCVLFRGSENGAGTSVVLKGQFGSLLVGEEAAECIEGFRFTRSAKARKYRDDPDIRFDIVGLCTDICVTANAILLRTAFPEAEIRVHKAACAGVTKEKHQAALEVMRSCQISVV